MSPTKTKTPATSPERTVIPAGAGGAPTPQLIPEQVMSRAPGEGPNAPGVPALQPPGTEAAGLDAQAAAAGVTAISATVGGLWTSNHQSNSWVYLNSVGWRRLSPADPGAHHAMLQLARLAKDASITVQCEEDGSIVHTIYLW